MSDNYNSLIGKEVKILCDSGGNNRSVYNGKILSISDTFITIFDYKTSTEITVPLDKLIRIERHSGGVSDE